MVTNLFSFASLRPLIGAALLLVFFSGCTAGALRQARTDFYRNRVDEAAATLESDDGSRRDRLLFLMEKGLIYHRAGRYEESIKALLKASRLMEEQEKVSVSQQTGSMVINEWVTEYKGEYSERLWVHSYLMMNYLLLYKYEDALVEAKLALRRMREHSDALKGDYYTRALAALCYENLGLYSDAYIEYKKLAELMPNPVPAAPDLYRLALILGFKDEAAKYRKILPQGWEFSPKDGELVMFVGVGSGPVKIPGNIVLPPSIRVSFPQYKNRLVPHVQVMAASGTEPLVGTVITTDVSSVSKSALEERATLLMAKESARAAIKEAVAQAVGRKNDDVVVALVRTVLFLMEEPDTRGWETLPGALKLVRFRISPGAHTVQVRIQGGVSQTLTFDDIRIHPGARVYRSLRVSY